MLTLSRREGETLVLLTQGLEPIRIKLSRITGHNQARISIEAPGNVSIYREELLPRDSGDSGSADFSDGIDLIDLAQESAER